MLANTIKAKIASHGHIIIGTNDGIRSFAYTIGLTEQNLPELLIFGVSPDNAAIILNHAARLMKDDGEFKDGDASDKLAEGMSTGFKAFGVKAGEEFVCQAIFHYEGKPHQPRFLQVVVPDRAGLLPYQEGYDRAYMAKFQPHLWERMQ